MSIRTESFCTMCCSVTAREEAKKTTPTAGPTAKHTFLTKRPHSAERRHTGRLPPLLGEPAQTLKACSSHILYRQQNQQLAQRLHFRAQTKFSTLSRTNCIISFLGDYWSLTAAVANYPFPGWRVSLATAVFSSVACIVRIVCILCIVCIIPRPTPPPSTSHCKAPLPTGFLFF